MGESEENVTALPSESGTPVDGGEPVVEPLSEPTAETPEVADAVEVPVDAVEVPAPEAELDAIEDQLAIEEAPAETEAEQVAPGVEAGVEAASEVEGVAEAAPEAEPAPEADLAEEPATPPSDEELAAAVAAADEAVGTDGSLDSIAPASAASASEDLAAETAVRFGVPWWPFLVYLGLWVVFAGIAVWQFRVFSGGVFYESQLYTVLMYAGLGLTLAGPILILAVWLASRANEARQRAGLFVSAFFKGAIFTLAGVVIWWGTLMALDYLRIGRPF